MTFKERERTFTFAKFVSLEAEIRKWLVLSNKHHVMALI